MIMTKNIHVISTNKPSKLGLHRDNKLHLHDNLLTENLPEFNPQNIYITNDEEIKEGDYFYQEFDSIIHKCYKLTDNYVIAEKPSDYPKKICKKIILTTDSDLIKNGFQAIDDEFLEWFVKNSSCEKIKTESLNIGNGKLGYVICKPQIIIPKEESKQFVECKCTNALHAENCISNCGYGEEPKQETLEEVAKSEAFEFKVDYKPFETDLDYREYAEYGFEKGFIEGAKWQQERSFTLEQIDELFFNDKGGYFDDFLDYRLGLTGSQSKNKITFKEWFEKFKKK